jgi:hypothetical protein
MRVHGAARIYIRRIYMRNASLKVNSSAIRVLMCPPEAEMSASVYVHGW